MKIRSAGSYHDFFVKHQVPKLDCQGCTACCTSKTLYVRLDPEEIESGIFPLVLENQPGFQTGTRWMRKIEVSEDQPNYGHCQFVCESGCRIYKQHPKNCKEFDCRQFSESPFNPDWWSDDFPAWDFIIGKGDALRHWAWAFLGNFIDNVEGRYGLYQPTNDARERAIVFTESFAKALLREKLAPTRTIISKQQAEAIKEIALRIING